MLVASRMTRLVFVEVEGPTLGPAACCSSNVCGLGFEAFSFLSPFSSFLLLLLLHHPFPRRFVSHLLRV